MKYDVRIVESIPEIRKNGKVKKIKAKQVYIAPAKFDHVLLKALMDFNKAFFSRFDLLEMLLSVGIQQRL